MIGGSDIDIQAGKGAGCRAARVMLNNQAGREAEENAARIEEADMLRHPFLMQFIKFLSRAARKRKPQV